jgi:8-oxo-dGTP diphosphatase
MTAASGAFVPNREVDEIRWLDPPAARQLLTYAHDRPILDAATTTLRTGE